MSQCLGMTKKGTRCKKTTNNENSLCNLHSKDLPEKKEHSLSEDKNLLEIINFYPLTLTKKNKKYVEGYWESMPEIDPDGVEYEEYFERVKENFTKKNFKQTYPYPFPTTKKVNKEFIEKLKTLEKSIQNNKLGKIKNQKGSSYCRICGVTNNSKESSFEYKENKYKFPGGIFHYYEDHNVQPSKEFKKAVLGIKI